MKIYVASSWRNHEQQTIVRWLTACGQDVYDFKNPPNKAGFGWEQTNAGKPQRPATLMATLNDPIAEAGFEADVTALRECDICILVMPAGISANLELGYAAGAGKKTVVYIPDAAYEDGRAFEPELMWKVADHIVTDFVGLVEAVTPLIESDCRGMSASDDIKLPFDPGQRIYIEAEYIKEIDYVDDDGPGYVEGAMLMVAGKTVCVRADALRTFQSKDEREHPQRLRDQSGTFAEIGGKGVRIDGSREEGTNG